jgi:hypothetical protein
MSPRALEVLLAIVLLNTTISVEAQSIPTDKAAFTSYIADRLKDERPQGMPVQITVVQPLGIKLLAPSGLSIDANLSDLHGHCVAVQGRCAEAADKLVESAFQIFGELTSPIAPDMLRLVLRSASWIETLNARNQSQGLPPVIARRYVGELWAILAISGQSFTRYVGADTLGLLRLDEQAAYDRALENTKAAKAPILERAIPLRGTLFQVLSEDELEPSRLLMHSEWGRIARSRRGDLIVSVPASNALIFGHAQTGADLQSLREITENVSRSAIRSVSPQLFRWREDGWELVQERVGSAPASATVQAARPQRD